ncbi:hypothetical protein [Streptomyces sp. DSM 41634]|uniref:hypothetical protein n=1 Tax=Streptomyces sp. DSM 41634 TaxID=3448656 RepID=UPI0028838921|nr:hypothetical protein [Streptomyces sp. DSM 41633]
MRRSSAKTSTEVMVSPKQGPTDQAASADWGADAPSPSGHRALIAALLAVMTRAGLGRQPLNKVDLG